MIFYIRIADINIRISARYKKIFDICREYIIYPTKDTIISLHIDISTNDILLEENNMQENVWKEEKMHRSYDPALLEAVAVHRKIATALPLYDTFLMHGSVVAYKDKGYMFTAASGVGKTTRSLLWLNEFPGSFIVNGDKPFIQVRNNSVYAYGSPWAGKENYSTNTSVPLHVVFFLERLEEGESDSLIELGRDEVLSKMLTHCFKPNDMYTFKRTVLLLAKMQKHVKFYRFCSSPTTESIRMAWESVNNTVSRFE